MDDPREREQIFVGTCLAHPEEIPKLRQIVGPDAILDEHARLWYATILDVFDSEGSVDFINLDIALTAAGKASDPSKLFEVTMKAESVFMSRQLAQWIAEQFLRRQGREYLKTMDQLLLNPQIDVYEELTVLDDAVSKLKDYFHVKSMRSIVDVAHEATAEMEGVQSNTRKLGLPFYMADLDQFTGGMDNGDLIVLAALEKSGKSTLMIQTMFSSAEHGTPVGIISTEMKAVQILLRKACIDEMIPWKLAKQNKISGDEWVRLYKRIAVIGGLPILIRDGKMDIVDIQTEAALMVRRGVKAIAVDYIQRVVPSGRSKPRQGWSRQQSREQEVAAISSGLKDIAMEFDIPVLALSQVTETSDGQLRARESRAVEHDMDKMITLKHPDKPEIVDYKYPVDVKIRQRFGASGNFGDCKLMYHVDHGYWSAYSQFGE